MGTSLRDREYSPAPATRRERRSPATVDATRTTQTLIAPDDVPAHPYKVAMEVASLAPKAEVTIYPWKDSQEHIDEVVEHARRFLRAHAPVRAPRAS
jgi:hypothetical protein